MAESSVPIFSPFLAILRFAHLRDAAGQADVFAFAKARTSALRPKDPDDATQVVLWKIFRSSEQALLVLSRMAQKNGRLAEVLDHLEPGEMPGVDSAIVSECDQQLSGYVSQMIRNAEKDRFRRQRFTVPLPDDELLAAATPQLDDQEELVKLGSMALANAVENEARPEWLQQTLEEIQALARGDRTMDELTAECVASDAELAALAPAAARVRARNRLQQRHKRAREHLLVSIRSMVTNGSLTADEGREAERWLGLLRRRQNRGSGASSRDMTNKPSKELLAELGISVEQTRVIASAELDSGKVGQGLSGAIGSPFDLSDHFVGAALGSESLPFVVTKHQLEPAVFRLEELSGRIQITAGSAQRLDDDVLLDARAGRSSGVLVETAEGRMLIYAGPGGVTVSIVGEGQFWTWETWQVLPSTLSIAVPALAELTGGLGCERWLEERFAILVSEHAIAKVAGAGVVVRLWMPRPAERASAPDPSSLVAQWARKLTPQDLEATERWAVERAGMLRQELEGLPHDGELSAHNVIRIAYERDALQCVLTVLWLAGRGRQLGPEMIATDDAAVTSLSALPTLEELEADPLLRAVHVSEPDAWWGQLVSG